MSRRKNRDGSECPRPSARWPLLAGFFRTQRSRPPCGWPEQGFAGRLWASPPAPSSTCSCSGGGSSARGCRSSLHTAEIQHLDL